MCIDLAGTEYIRKIHYIGTKMEDAKGAVMTSVISLTVNLSAEKNDEKSKKFILQILFLWLFLGVFVAKVRKILVEQEQISY